MSTLVRIVVAIASAGVVCAVSAIFVWRFDPSALVLPAFAILGGLVATLIARGLQSRIMMGVASIAGGIIGAIAGANVLGLNIRMGPMAVLAGAILGAAIWLAKLSMPISDNAIGTKTSERELARNETDRREGASAYLLVSLLSIVFGPILGIVLFLVYYFAVGIHPLDKWYYLGVHFAMGAVSGLLVGGPYLIVWFSRVGRRR